MKKPIYTKSMLNMQCCIPRFGCIILGNVIIQLDPSDEWCIYNVYMVGSQRIISAMSAFILHHIIIQSSLHGNFLQRGLYSVIIRLSNDSFYRFYLGIAMVSHTLSAVCCISEQLLQCAINVVHTCIRRQDQRLLYRHLNDL